MKDLLKWIDDIGINNIIWVTDLDLTVLDSHKDPNQVRAPDGFEETCRRLDAATQDRFFIITGRELSYVNTVFPGTPFKASTEYHNVARWDPSQPPVELNPQPQWSLIDDKIEAVIRRWWPDDFKVREKPFMRSIHYTHAPALQDENTKKQAQMALEQILIDYEHLTGQKLTNIDGGQVFDIAPAGSSKEKAYQDIMDMMMQKHPGRDLAPIYFGDSPGDLDAVPVVNAHGGAFISVGSDPKVTRVADFRLDNTAMCRKVFKKASFLHPKQTRTANYTSAPAGPDIG